MHAVKTELRQVFLNILKNSFEAIDGEGTITVVTRLINSDSDKKQVSIVFSDTGHGIDEQIIKNLFVPFFSTKNSLPLNMGLGLSISYNIITKYSGTMTIRNREGSGCETVITLPVIS